MISDDCVVAVRITSGPRSLPGRKRSEVGPFSLGPYIVPFALGSSFCGAVRGVSGICDCGLWIASPQQRDSGPTPRPRKSPRRGRLCKTASARGFSLLNPRFYNERYVEMGKKWGTSRRGATGSVPCFAASILSRTSVRIIHTIIVVGWCHGIRGWLAFRRKKQYG